MDIKIIPTTYKGRKFRSRLEARWAVFFDALDWEWEYEFEGFKLPSGYYLPDFYFPEHKMFAEVKHGKINATDFTKCCELSIKYPVLLLEGAPDEKPYRYLYEGVEHCECTFVKKGCKYWPLFYAYDFDGDYFYDTVLAVNKARAARFEFWQI